MRIISGKYKGKKLEGFDIDGTRPTMDRVRESVFAIIQNRIEGSECLDLFAGSGSLGLEALSMGAKACTFVDNNPKVIRVLNRNVENVKENITIINMDYKRYLKETVSRFDIIFLDPPYKAKVLNKAIKKIEEIDILNDGGIIVCEYEGEEPETIYELVKEKRYGNKFIKIFKK